MNCPKTYDITDIQLDILKHAYYEKFALNPTTLAEQLVLKYGGYENIFSLIKRLDREMKKLEQMSLLKRLKEYKSRFYAITKEGGELYFNLIKRKQNSNSNFETVNWEIEAPKRFIGGINRFIALYNMQNKKYLSEHDRAFICRRFEDYNEKTKGKVIILKSLYGKQYKLIPYHTRFNNNGRLRELLDKFDKIIEYEIQNSKFAVFLTLTTDFKRFDNVVEANREFQKGINRFMTYCRKYANFKFRYLCSYEFTKKGVLHAHIIIFGTKWLMHGSKISQLWDREGIGKIIKIYALKNDGTKFTWLRAKPDNTTEKSGTDYLKKYIIKAFFDDDEERALYWLFNKRFYTYSRLYSKVLKLSKKPVNDFKLWEFFGIFKLESIPQFILDNINKWRGIGWTSNTLYHSDGGMTIGT